MKLPEGFLIRCATAVSEDACAFVLSERMVDDPLSIVVLYNRTYRQPWGRFDIPEEIVAACYAPHGPASAGTPFALLSEEASVYFVGLSIAREDVPAAGLRKPGSRGLGTMTALGLHSDRLLAAGRGGQVYFRDPDGEWGEPTAGRIVPAADRSEAVPAALAVASGAVVAGGWITDDRAAPETDALFDDDFEAFMDAAIAEAPVSRAALWIERKDGWEALTAPEAGLVSTLLADPQEGLLAGLTNGVIVAAGPDGDVREFAAFDAPAGIVAMVRHAGRLVVASEEGLFTAAEGAFLPFDAPPPPDLGFIVGLSAAGEALWVFSDDAVHILRNGRWDALDVPDALLALPFEGLPG